MARHVLTGALLAFAACASRAPAIEPLGSGYRFTPGDVLRFRVESRLDVDMEGTHPAFLLKGMTRPLAWDLEGEFDNLVLDVDESGDAQIERRVSHLRSSGHYLDEKFGVTWSRDNDKTVSESGKLKSQMDQYVARMIDSPLSGRIDVEGNTTLAAPVPSRLVVRQGMMYWPIPKDKIAWHSHDVMAVPILHDKVELKFENSIKEVSGGIAFIVAPVALKSGGEGATSFIVSGGAKAEFDVAAGRLKSLELEIRIAFSGKGPVPGGGEGDVRGVATYRETQRLVQ